MLLYNLMAFLKEATKTKKDVMKDVGSYLDKSKVEKVVEEKLKKFDLL